MNKPLEPVMPSWDVSLVAPVGIKTYTLGEIAERDPSLLQTVPGSTQLYLKTSVQAAPTFVGDRVTMDPISADYHAELGALSVTSGSMRLNVQIPGFIPGSNTIVPLVPATDVPAVTGELPHVRVMAVESGSVELRLWNRMPVALRIENPITLTNESGSTIATFDFGSASIAAGQVQTATTSLAGKTVYQRVRLGSIRISSPGSGSSFVTIPDSMLLADITPRGLVANSATLTNIPAKHYEEVSELPLTSQTLVRDVWLNRGTLGLRFVSRVNLRSTLHLRLPELLRPSGQPYELTLALAPRDSFTLSVDLARFRLHSLDGSYLRSLRAEYEADMLGSEGEWILLSSTDNVSVHVTTSDVHADSAVAAIQPTIIAVDERIALNLGELSTKFRGQLDIPAAEMAFTPQSTIDVPMELRLRFEARNSSGNTVSLDMPVTKGGQMSEAIAFVQGDVGRFLTSLSGTLPDSLRVVGSIVLNPDYDTTAPAHIGRNCSFAGNVDLSIPMSLRIVDGHFADTLVIGDTTGDGSTDKRIDESTIEHVNYGQLHVEIDNGLPLDVKVKIGLLDRTRAMLLNLPQTEGDSIAIGAGSLVNGDVHAASRTTRIFELQGADFRQFNLADLVKIDLALATGGSTTVNFRTTDQVRVKMWAQFSYRVNP
jgi:hypothetical protein